MRAAYGDGSTRLSSRLGAIAQALNGGDFAAAMIAAVHTQTPELSSQAATRLTNADRELTKYNYNPDEPRDWRGRWTSDGSVSPTSVEVPRPTPVAALGDDMMRNIVKNACIAECSESNLATHDYGWKFFNCVRDCMIRHGHDPFLFRL